MNTKDVINQKIADLDKLIENLRHQDQNYTDYG